MRHADRTAAPAMSPPGRSAAQVGRRPATTSRAAIAEREIAGTSRWPALEEALTPALPHQFFIPYLVKRPRNDWPATRHVAPCAPDARALQIKRARHDVMTFRSIPLFATSGTGPVPFPIKICAPIDTPIAGRSPIHRAKDSANTLRQIKTNTNSDGLACKHHRVNDSLGSIDSDISWI